MTETEFVDTSKVSVREISKSIAKVMIEKNHYSHKWTSCKHALGIFHTENTPNAFFEGVNEKLIGCIIYGSPVGREAVSSISDNIKTNEVLELTRLWIADNYGKNIESYSISQSFRWLKANDANIKVLISYADPEYGHSGGIYRATNWKYQGRGKLTSDHTVDYKDKGNYSIRLTENGKWIHSRTVGVMYGSRALANLKKEIGHTFWKKLEPTKHRYIYFLCNKKEKKRLLKTMKMPILPYPTVIGEFIPTIEKVVVKNVKEFFNGKAN